MHAVILDGFIINPGDLSWKPLEAMVSLKIYDRTPEALIVERSRGAEIVLTTKVSLSAETIQQLPSLRHIGVLATGFNIIDIAAASARGVVVTNIPNYGTDSVAQGAFALLLELCHKVRLHSEAARAGEWSASPDWSFSKAPLTELAGKTMGIVGFGRIGSQVARIAEAFGMRVIAASRSGAAGAWVDVDELFSVSDVVSLHCPLTPATQGMVNAARLRRMKRTALLINTSRGPLVEEQDLADALNQGLIAGAGLDVLSVEPPPADHPLLHAKNCVVTPHVAWATQEARARLMEIGVANVAAFLRGEPQNVITSPVT
ncbi:MAG: D-2-hydroxyacid dehydrogenase [Bryobacteraceae bacterium]